MKDQRKRENEERKQQAKQTKINEAKAAIKHILANVKEAKPKSCVEERSGHPNTTTRSAVADLLNDDTLVNQSYQDTQKRTQPNGLILATMATLVAAKTDA